MTRPGGSAKTLPNRGAVSHSKNKRASGPLAAQAASVVGGDESVCLLAGAEGRLPCSK
jgi:hypothetical protein